MPLHHRRTEPASPDRARFDWLSLVDIAQCTSKTAATDGMRYWRQGHVFNVTVGPTGKRVTAQVRGSRPKPYMVSIDFEELDDKSTLIEGDCTCRIAMDCEHVAATLFALMAQKTTPPAAPKRVATALELFPGLKPSIAPPAPRLEVLDPDLAAWIDSLARLEQSESEDYPPDVHRRVFYLLDVVPCAETVPHLMATPVSVRLLRNGRFSDKVAAVHPEYVLQRNIAQFVRSSDREIFRRLVDLKRSVYVPGGIVLHGEEGVPALESIIKTGRARWRAVEGPITTRGPSAQGRLVWRLRQDGSQSPDFALEALPTAQVLRMTPPWYVDTATGTMGPVETGLNPKVAAQILAAPPVPARQAKLLRARIARHLPAMTVGPTELEPVERIEAQPVPGLRLLVWDRPPEAGRRFGQFGRTENALPPRFLHARLFFRYDGVEVTAHDKRDHPAIVREGRMVEVVRDRNFEQKAAERLVEFGFQSLSHLSYAIPADIRNDFELVNADFDDFDDFHDIDGLDGFAGLNDPDDNRSIWTDFIYRDVPLLQNAGWVVEVAPNFPIRLVRPDGELSAEFREKTGVDWFELDLGVLVDGERIDLVPAILAAFADPAFDVPEDEDLSDDDEPFYLPLSDGRILAMPAARLQPILATLQELFTAGAIDSKSKRIAFSSRDAGSIVDIADAASELGVVWRGGERIRELGRLLRDTGSIPRAELPASFTATLRPYQARGVDWLQFLRAAGLGGILADDMGLGKTVQALAHLAIEKVNGRMDRPALVVAPTSVLANWRREAERFVPDLKVLTLHGLDRKSRFGEIAGHDLVLTTYPLLARDHATLRAQPWHAIILDEAQTIKNPETATTQLVFNLEARHRVCLTGTPLENHLGEVWSLFAFLSPGFLGDRQTFKQRWRTPIEKHGDTDRRRLLARRIRPFLLRRTKAEVASDLPPKTEIIESIEMESAQRDVYESIRLAVHGRVQAAIACKGLARSRIVVLDALLKLRQACCDPRLLKLDSASARKARSAKLDRLMEMLPELIDEGRRVLLFSQFTSMLALIEDALRTARIPYIILTGETHDRETPVQRFQKGEVPLFLISLKAGGLGLNLTAADTVIHYDPWWNPAVEDQATDRAHRIGQDKPVFVHKMMMLASIEEKIEALKARKRDLAAGLFDPDAGSTLELTERDIEDLFAFE